MKLLILLVLFVSCSNKQEKSISEVVVEESGITVTRISLGAIDPVGVNNRERYVIRCNSKFKTVCTCSEDSRYVNQPVSVDCNYVRSFL